MEKITDTELIELINLLTEEELDIVISYAEMLLNTQNNEKDK